MAKEFFKKVAIGVAIALVSTAAVAGVSALAKTIRNDESDLEGADCCTHAGVIETPGVAPSCTEGGSTDGSICGSCGGIIQQQMYLPALGHIEVVVPAVAPTCKTPGLTEGLSCGVCGEVFTAQREIPVIGCVDEDLDNHCDMCTQAMPEGITLLRKIANSDNVVETAVVEGTTYSAGTVVRIYHGSAGVASNWISVGSEALSFVRSYYNESFSEEGFIEPLYQFSNSQRFEGEIYAYVTETYIDYYIGPGIMYDSLGEVLYEITDSFVIGRCNGPGGSRTAIITLTE